MFVLLKIIHFLSFSVAVGGGVASMVIGIRAAKLEMVQAIPLRQAQGIIGKFSTLGLILLWLSGLWMYSMAYGGDVSMGQSFWIKMAAVVLLTVVSGFLNYKVITATRAGVPPDVALVKKAGMAMGLLAVIAIIAAIYAFT